MRAFLAFLLIVAGLAAAAIYSSAFIVHQTEQALVLQFGKPKEGDEGFIKNPGLYWKIPWVDTVHYFDKRILDLETQKLEVTASDQKRLVVDAFTRYRIVNPLLFYQSVTDERNVRSRLGPVAESALRSVLGSASFTDLVRDKRDALMGEIAKQVNDNSKEFGIEVVDFRIKRADLPEQNSKSVFDRMRAERNREANEFRAQGDAEANRIKATADREALVIRAEATKKGEQTRGEGDAERNRIYAEAYGRDPDFFAFYRSMQAYEQGLKAGDTRLVISPTSDFFRYFSDPMGGRMGSPAPTVKQ